MAEERIVFKFNPDYERFMPKMGPEDFEIMKEDIKQKGLLEPVEVLPDFTVIDGHSRIKACEALGIEIPKEKIKVVQLPIEAIMDYIFSKNVARRHLTDLQRLNLVQQCLPQLKLEKKKQADKKRGERMAEGKKTKSLMPTPKIGGKKSGPPAPKKSPGPGGTSAVRKEVATKAGVSEAAVREHEFVKKWAPELLEGADKDVKIGTLYTQANEWYQAVKMDKGMFKAVVDKEISLKDAYDKIQSEKPKEPEKKTPGPIQKLLIEIRNMVDKTIKKYHDGEFKPSTCELEICQKLDSYISKYEGK